MDLIKKRIFYIFLFVQALLFTLLPALTRTVASIDSMEAVSWGQMFSFGTNKHPPFSGWLAYGFFNFFTQHDFALYLLGQLCLILGFIYIYKLAKYFLSEEKALCSSLIISTCFYYTYQTYIDNFNCNIISMGLWPVVTYYFYKSVKENRLKDWIILGISAGLAFLGKYQAVFLFFPMFLYLLIADRKQFKQTGLYLSIVSASLVVLPHIVWLFKTDFFSLLYIIGRTDIADGNTPKVLLPFGRIVFPVKFYLDQILAVLPCVGLYLILALKEKSIRFVKNPGNKSDSLFLFLIGLVPVILLGAMGAVANSRVIGTWGSTMVSYFGILLFYFFPIEFKKDTYKFFIKWLIALMMMWIIGIWIFSQIQTKKNLSYPKETVMQDFDNIWAGQTNNAPLKYVTGNIDYIFQFNIYNNNHPKIILETFGYKNPWIDHEDVLKSGALVIGKNDEDVIERTKESIYLLPEDYEIIPKTYTMNICNRFGKCVEEDFSYVIIPGVK